MNYRIMKIGTRYAIQNLVHIDKPYIDRESDDLWFTPNKIVNYCMHDTFEAAKNRAEIYFSGESIDAKKLLDEAVEVQS